VGGVVVRRVVPAAAGVPLRPGADDRVVAAALSVPALDVGAPVGVVAPLELPPPICTTPTEPVAVLPPPQQPTFAGTVAEASPASRVAAAVTEPACATAAELSDVLPPPSCRVASESSALFPLPAVATAKAAATAAPAIEAPISGLALVWPTCTAPIERLAELPPPTCAVPIE
jgi:hypothetical protein